MYIWIMAGGGRRDRKEGEGDGEGEGEWGGEWRMGRGVEDGEGVVERGGGGKQQVSSGVRYNLS